MSQAMEKAGRQYREYVREHYAHYNKTVPGTSMVVLDFSAPRPERPKHGDRWGPWRYDQENLTLEFENSQNYYIDLEQCNTSAQVLDWIFQIERKVWVSREDLGHLIQALKDLLHPQANLCSYGHSKTMDVREHLKSNSQ